MIILYHMISIFDIFKIGIGPSSSHTVGPMKASYLFINEIKNKFNLDSVNRIKIDLYGSLALTKSGHGTDIALMLGLCGYTPKDVDPNEIDNIINNIRENKKIKLNFEKSVDFNEDIDITTHKTEELPYHPNGLIITAYDNKNDIIFTEEYYSVGGGFVETKDEISNKKNKKVSKDVNIPYDFISWGELYEICKKNNKEVWEIVLENEKSINTEEKINEQIEIICNIMEKSIFNSLEKTGVIKGGLNLERRSKNINKNIQILKNDNLKVIDNLLLWGMMAGEENASYGQIITAPTNGAAGIIPAVLQYYKEFHESTNLGLKKFILTAGAVGILCKMNASISGAEGGCQAEVGSATAMAAAGLCAALGGTIEQCENAAIIGLSHNLGLVCDPVGGLVQVPCIERNAINAVKAVSACRLAMLEKESIYLSLDQVIQTLKEVGDDMPMQYRETALGGLAKNASVGKCNNCANCNNCY